MQLNKGTELLGKHNLVSFCVTRFKNSIFHVLWMQLPKVKFIFEKTAIYSTLIRPSRTAHLYIAVSILDFFLARDISFYEYVVHRSAVKRDCVRLAHILSVWSVGI